MSKPSPADRAAAMVAVALERERCQKSENRRLMPKTAAIIEQFQTVFGTALPYGKFSENGRTVRWGRSPEERWTGPRALKLVNGKWELDDVSEH